MGAHGRWGLLLQQAGLERVSPSSGVDSVLRVGCLLSSRAWGALPLRPARACGLPEHLPAERHAPHEAGSGAILHQLRQPREAHRGHGKACARCGGCERALPVQNVSLRREGGHPISQADVHGGREQLTNIC